MLHPEQMVRVVVTGMRSDESAVMSALQKLRSVEVIDYSEGEGGFSPGRSDGSVEDISKKVIMLRTLIKELELEQDRVKPLSRTEASESMGERFSSIRSDLSVALKEREVLEEESKLLTQKIKDYAPFQTMGLDLDSYRDYRTIKVFVGLVLRDVSSHIMKASQGSYSSCTASKDGRLYLCAFVPKDDMEKVSKLLLNAGYQDIIVPEGEGDASRIFSQLTSQIAEISQEMENAERKISTLKGKYKQDILAIEELLSEQIERLEAPLRLATSKNAFIADLWVPKKAYEGVVKTVEKASGGRTVCIKVAKGKKEEEPIIMKNPRILSPFEAMVRLFSPPSYGEVDPTIMMSLFFPIFFGLMVSDVGFGIMLTIIGALFVRGRTLGFENIVSRTGLRQVGNILLYGGLLATLFGLLVFGEMFGLPFKAEYEGALAWNIPILVPTYHIEKFSNIGDLLVLSIIFAGLHLGLGMIIGIANNATHNKRHALGKLGWLLILIGLVSMLLIFASDLGNRLSQAVVSGFLYPLKGMMFQFGSMLIPTTSVLMVLVGIPIAIAGEGGVAIIEMFTLVSNVFSYARIAAIGIADAGVHFGFNQMLLPPMISAYSSLDMSSLLTLVSLAFVLFIAHLLVFVLGSFSAGIQSLRLHFFEFFTKFYEGGGREFSPFGRKLKYVKEV